MMHHVRTILAFPDKSIKPINNSLNFSLQLAYVVEQRLHCTTFPFLMELQ